MAEISLNQVASVLGSKTVSGMAQKMGLWPPHPTVSVRDLVSPKCLTQHYDNARTGWNPFEATLTASNVSQLKQLFTEDVDARVYAQPLYVHHVLIPGQGLHNVVYVVTENDTVYAFDADFSQPPLWQRSLIPPGEQIVVEADISDNMMYVVAKTKKVAGSNTSFHYRTYALDITTGLDRVAPVEIAGSVPGTGDPNDGHGHVFFDPHWHLKRKLAPRGA